MAKLLSTKVLSPKNHKKIRDARIKISDYNAIKIEKIDFNVNQRIENAIFTSKNSVKAVIKQKIKDKKLLLCWRKNKIITFKKWRKSSKK